MERLFCLRPSKRSKMIRFLLILGLSLALLVPSAAGAGSAATKPKLIVGGDHDCPPYEFLENGEPTGFNIELMRAVADVMGFDVEFRLGPWINVRQDLEQGHIDALAGMYYSVDRSRLVDFSVPHTLVTSGLFVRKDSPIRSYADIQGKKIIVQEGDIIHDVLKRNGLASRIVTVTDPGQVLQLLASGKHDCALMPSRLQGEHYLKTFGLANIRIINTDLPHLKYCFAVRKGNRELLYQLDEGLKILKVKGKYRQIYEKWFGVYEEKNLWNAVRYYVLAIAIVAALGFVFLVWSRMLKKLVEERTAELRRSEEALRFTQYAIDRTLDQAFWMTEDGRLFYVNDAACRTLGYSREELVGMSMPDIDPTHPPEVFAEHWRNLRKHGSITMESLHRAKDGRVYPVEIRANYVVFDGREYNCAFVTDISKRKQMEEELRHARDELEKRVKERTAELRNANELLEREITERKRTENVNTARLRLLQFASTHDMDELLQATLDEAEALTGSLIGFYHFLEADQNTLLLQNWSTRTKAEFCKSEGKGSHYDISDAGVWVDCIRERRPVVHNDYGSLPHRKGLPPGHAPLIRELVVPVFRGDKIAAILGVGNKPQDYTSEDVEAVSMLADLAWEITERKQTEEALRLAKEEWERTFASVPDLIAIIDNRHRILRVNEAMGKRLGLKPDECVGLHCYEAIHGLSEPPPFCPHAQTLRDGIKHLAEVHEERLGGDFLVSTTPLNDERGVMTGSVHIAYDITERKRAEEALRESESRVRRKLESILDPEGDIGELDLADILDASGVRALVDDLYRMTGLKMSIIDLKGRVLADAGWQDICSKFHRHHPETLKRCHESDTDLTVGVPQGEFRTYRCKNNMWHLVTPIVVGERHMGNLFLGQFFFAGEELDYDLFRSQARKYSFPEEEYIAALEAVPRHSEELVNLGKAVLLRLTDMFSKLSYANIKLAHSLAERDRLTATLREANLVVENSPVVLFRWKGDDEWPVELVSGNIKQFGYTPDEFLSGAITYSSIIHPDDLERVTREVHGFCDGGAEQFRLEYRIMTKGGDVRWVNEHTHVERDADGEVKNFEGIVIDVTERKKAEDSIRESRAKYQAIVDSFDGLIYISSQDYRIEFMNRKLIERTGRDAVGEYCYKVMNDLDSVCPWCINDRVFAGETVHREMYSPKDNRWYYAVNVPIRHAGGSMSKHSMIIDITERKLFEEELQRQKKLLQELNETLERRVGEEVAKNREKDIMLIQQNRQAAMGDLLDHIAHQWKQPLTIASLLVQNLWALHARKELTADKIQETIDKTTALLEHMAQTIEVFRDFYRPDKEKTAFRIGDSVDNALAFISPALKYQSIDVELDVDPGLLATGYPREYTQVLLNVLSNARDALIERKTEKPKIVIRGFAEGNRAVVTITDNAGGIPESIVHNIFDLYVTTKEASGGTGIGLHMSKNIIEKNMDGSLTARNTDSGAQFRIAVNMPNRGAL